MLYTVYVVIVAQWMTPSENRHEGEIAKLRDMVAVEACRGR
jgi:hypothetical protein